MAGSYAYLIFWSKDAADILNPILPVPYSVRLLKLCWFYAENNQIINHTQNKCACWDVTLFSSRIPRRVGLYTGTDVSDEPAAFIFSLPINNTVPDPRIQFSS
jgi:hypothetical protein